MTFEEIFYRFLTGTDNDKAEVREFIQRHENLHTIHGRELSDAALNVPTSEHIEFEDERYTPHHRRTT